MANLFEMIFEELKNHDIQLIENFDKCENNQLILILDPDSNSNKIQIYRFYTEFHLMVFPHLCTCRSVCYKFPLNLSLFEIIDIIWSMFNNLYMSSNPLNSLNIYYSKKYSNLSIGIKQIDNLINKIPWNERKRIYDNYKDNLKLTIEKNVVDHYIYDLPV